MHSESMFDDEDFDVFSDAESIDYLESVDSEHDTF